MKSIEILLILILLICKSFAQNIYEVQPGIKNNQIILELANISITETAQIKSLPKFSKGGAKERIKFVGETEKSVELRAGETREVVFGFDVDYNIGTTKSDTIEFLITGNNRINITKQFIFNYTVPKEYKLEQNYPNPFNPSTRISWQSPVGSWQTIKLYDLLGREIETIVDGYYETGFHSTLFIVNSSLPSGVYFYRLQAGDFVQTKKMMLLR
ncbi:MAG: T9SS type A sorting domain-containing protein [Ignavibacterium album]|uniref:T9SS type A sorting domain-containing protein n=1 Tax=Ignavibacterium album TaxID=591197 RepID=UPI0026E998FE|nr:T9SS type A sorting domain-containing protein [Ignavibacterium album]MCX8105458.1 T9SS type A sorting domain-containing protein [Ignavibacterium album]